MLSLCALSHAAVNSRRRTSARKLPQLDNDECPAGCMNGTDALQLLGELSVCQLEQRQLRNRIRTQGHEEFDEATAGLGFSAVDIVSGLLRDTEQLARRRSKCAKCVSLACAEPSVTRFLTDDTEVIVYDGRKVHACRGCRCAYRELAEHTRDQYLRASKHSVTRAVVASTPLTAVITDHALYDHGGNAHTIENVVSPPTKRAIARRLRAMERECFDDTDAGDVLTSNSTVLEHTFGRGAIRTYMAQLNSDGTMGRLSIFVYRHE